MGRGPYMRGWSGSTSPSSIQGAPGIAQDPQYSREILYVDPSVSVSYGNVYKTYDEADAALQALGNLAAEVVIIGSVTMTAGASARRASGVLFSGVFGYSSALTIASGVTLDGMIQVGAHLTVTNSASKPITAAAGFNILQIGLFSTVKSSGPNLELVDTPNGAYTIPAIGDGAKLGDGTNEVIAVQVGGVIFASPTGFGAEIKDNVASGPAGSTFLVSGNNPSSKISASHANFAGTFSIGTEGDGAGIVKVVNTDLAIGGTVSFVQQALDGLFNGTLQRLRLDPTAGDPASPVEGDFWWDEDDHCLVYQTDASGVINQVGQEVQFRAVNKTGAQIANGSLVYVSGAQGNRPTITKAIGDGSVSPDVVIGMTTHAIDDNADGIVTTFGLVRELNTNGLAAGTKLWLSDSVAGAWTATRPKYPSQESLIGYVTVESATVGEVFVAIDHFQNELHHLPLLSTNPTNGTLWALGHQPQIVAGQSITTAAPYTSGSDFHNDEAVLNISAVSGPITIQISGSSVNETTQAITPADTEDIAVSGTGYYRSSKKWINTPTFTILEAASSCTADIYRSRYWDAANRDFRMTGWRIELLPNAAAWSFTVTMYRRESDGSLTTVHTNTYANTDTYRFAANGEPGTLKVTDETIDFEGSGSEGLIVKIATTAIRYCYMDLRYAHTPA